MHLIANLVFFIGLFYCNEIEVSSSAVAASRQSPNGHIQTFINTESKAKAKNNHPLYSTPQNTNEKIDHFHPNNTDDHHNKKEWDYKKEKDSYDPDIWKDIYPVCGGSHQSPIKLVLKDSTILKKTEIFKRVSFNDKIINNLTSELINGTFMNNGHTFGFKLNNDSKFTILMEDNSSFILSQFHLHYSCDLGSGSEHSINGRKEYGELHLLFYNQSYQDETTAMLYENGLRIYAIMIAIDDALEYSFLRKYEDIVFPLIKPNLNNDQISSIKLSDFPLYKELINKLIGTNLFSYKGSLTTPPCFETVTWFVFEEPIYIISKRDKMTLDQIYGFHGKLCNNFRPLQNTNDRKIYYINNV